MTQQLLRLPPLFQLDLGLEDDEALHRKVLVKKYAIANKVRQKAKSFAFRDKPAGNVKIEDKAKAEKGENEMCSMVIRQLLTKARKAAQPKKREPRAFPVGVLRQRRYTKMRALLEESSDRIVGWDHNFD